MSDSMIKTLLNDDKVLSFEITGYDRGADTDSGDPQPIFKVIKVSPEVLAEAHLKNERANAISASY